LIQSVPLHIANRLYITNGGRGALDVGLLH
jgi:hypothetical protein